MSEHEYKTHIQKIIAGKSRTKPVLTFLAILVIISISFLVGFYAGKNTGPSKIASLPKKDAAGIESEVRAVIDLKSRLEIKLRDRFGPAKEMADLKDVLVTDKAVKVSLWLKPPAIVLAAWEIKDTRKISDAVLKVILEEIKALNISPISFKYVAAIIYSYSPLEGGTLLKDGNWLLGMSFVVDGIPWGFHSGEEIEELDIELNF